MKKFIGMLCVCVLFSIAFAAEISLEPASGSLGNGCIVPINIMVDTNGQTISATDIIIESSMEFVDFVPTDVFPYYLPPKVMSNVVHIVGFTVDQAQRYDGKASIGTAYFKQVSELDRDGAVRLYFTKTGDTIDSNLSIAGGVDVLEKVAGAYYTFDGIGTCTHQASEITGGIKESSLDQALSMIPQPTEKSVEEPVEKNVVIAFISSNIYLLSLIVLIIVIVLFYLAKRVKGKKS